MASRLPSITLAEGWRIPVQEVRQKSPHRARTGLDSHSTYQTAPGTTLGECADNDSAIHGVRLGLGVVGHTLPAVARRRPGRDGRPRAAAQPCPVAGGASVRAGPREVRGRRPDDLAGAGALG